jgi:hypothetical protein
MPQLIYLVVDDPLKVDEVVQLWIDKGVSGLTILDSSGWARRMGKRNLADDVPLFPSIRGLMRGQERTNRTLFSVVPDGWDIEDLIEATEEVLGPLDDPDTGILFVVPVSVVKGLKPRVE